jgi:excinuclease ABC subunit C
MELEFSVAFDANCDLPSLLEATPAGPAVFALFPRAATGAATAPYLARTRNLRRRLARLLAPRRAPSRMLNLRDLTGRIAYQVVGSSFEALWLLYRLNRQHYPTQYRARLRLKPPALLKINLANRFPRCYPTRRLRRDGSLYYGPFPSQVAAERFAAEFLDLFKIRRCVEELNPDPAHPGCIYSQLRMCLAPCFVGCTDQEYHAEVGHVVEFLDAQGRSLLGALEAERAQASEALAFEQAAKIHRRIEKVHEVLRQKSDLVRNLRDLHAVVMQRSAEPQSVLFFRVRTGELCGPATLSFDERVSSPTPLDEQLHNLLESLAASDERSDVALDQASAARRARRAVGLPPWEHLALLARWYYSSFREGELVMLDSSANLPHSRLIRLCRKLLAREG